MAPLPDYSPRQLSLGPLETEILNLVWAMGRVTAKDIHARLLEDPDRELAYPSVMTVLHRLEKKGWLTREKRDRALWWQPRVSQQDAQIIRAHDQLQQFLAVSNPDTVAAFVDSLDDTSLEHLEAIARRIQAVRKAREVD